MTGLELIAERAAAARLELERDPSLARWEAVLPSEFRSWRGGYMSDGEWRRLMDAISERHPERLREHGIGHETGGAA